MSTTSPSSTLCKPCNKYHLNATPSAIIRLISLGFPPPDIEYLLHAGDLTAIEPLPTHRNLTPDDESRLSSLGLSGLEIEQIQSQINTINLTSPAEFEDIPDDVDPEEIHAATAHLRAEKAKAKNRERQARHRQRHAAPWNPERGLPPPKAN